MSDFRPQTLHNVILFARLNLRLARAESHIYRYIIGTSGIAYFSDIKNAEQNVALKGALEYNHRM